MGRERPPRERCAGIYLERPAPALTRLDAAVTRLTALGHTEEAEPLSSLAARLREEG